MLKAKLIVVGGDAIRGEFKLQLPAVIGRGKEANLTLCHPLVSRLHCEIFERDNQLFVKDLDSLNGTFVNNQRIDEEFLLEPEQLLTLGNVTFRAFHCFEEGTESEMDQLQASTAAGLSSLTRLEPISATDDTMCDDSAEESGVAQSGHSGSDAVANQLASFSANNGVGAEVQVDLGSETMQSEGNLQRSNMGSLNRNLPR